MDSDEEDVELEESEHEELEELVLELEELEHEELALTPTRAMKGKSKATFGQPAVAPNLWFMSSSSKVQRS